MRFLSIKEQYTEFAVPTGVAATYLLTFLFGLFSALKMEGTCGSKMVVDFQGTTWHYIADKLLLS
jgi:hypothetical protein